MIKNKQQGFSILAVILVIVTVIVAIGVWTLSGQTNTTSSNKSPDILASSILADAETYQIAFDKLVLSGVNSRNIVFLPNTASTTSAPNILDPVNGTAYKIPNANIFAKDAVLPEGIWIYNANNFFGKRIGLNTNPDPVLLLGGITDSVCASINASLYGTFFNSDGTTNNPYADTMDNNAWLAGATSTNPNTTVLVDLNVNIFSYNSPSGWMSGCLFNYDGTKNHNIYFHILKVN